MRTSVCSTLIALLGLALPVHAAPAPIVFDFEDGLQGWELHDAATRMQTQLLGGEWAIFGDGFLDPCCGGVGFGTSISIKTDLTDIASISVEQFFVDGSEDGLLLLLGFDLIDTVFIGILHELDVIEPGNPSLRGIDVSTITGAKTVGFVWGFELDSGSPPPPIVGFIDNITFHPVPEPATAVLFGLGMVALAGVRRLSWRQ